MLSMKPGAVARYAPNEDGKGQNARIQEIWPIYGIQSCPFFWLPEVSMGISEYVWYNVIK